MHYTSGTPQLGLDGRKLFYSWRVHIYSSLICPAIAFINLFSRLVLTQCWRTRQIHHYGLCNFVLMLTGNHVSISNAFRRELTSVYDVISEHFSIVIYSLRQVIHRNILFALLFHFKMWIREKKATCTMSKKEFFIISNLLVDNDLMNLLSNANLR